MFLGWRDLLAAKGRFALVGVVVCLVALLSTLLAGLAAGLVNDGISGLRGLPLTHLVFQKGAHESFSRSSLTETEAAPYARIQGVSVSPVGVSFFNARTSGGDTLDLALFGVPPGSFLAPRRDAQAALSGPSGLVLSSAFRSKGVKVGDKVTVVGPDIALPVVGFTYTGSYGHVDIAFTSLETWQRLMYGENAKGRFSAVALRVPDHKAAQLAAIDRRLDTESTTKAGAFNGSPGFSAETATMTLIRGFLLVISAMVVGAFFTVWTVQRTRQIGLMKALGASTAYVVRDSLAQLAVLLVAATAVGVLLALAVGTQLRGAPFSLEPGAVLVTAASLVVLGMLGSLAAIRRITGVDPIVAMREQ